jgi:hypothetical protein
VLSAMVADRMISKNQAASANSEPALTPTGPGC